MKIVNKTSVLFMLMTCFWQQPVYADILKDPTMPPGFGSLQNQSVGINTAPRFVLSSTLIAPARRLATINGKTLSVGEHISGARIVSIEPARVALQDGNKRIVLTLLPEKIKRNY